MATRSTISYKVGKKGKTIYCHWDGYPSNNGAILKKHYNTIEKVKKLIKLGDISILGETIGKKVKFDGFNSRESNQCLAYGRDRGDTGIEAVDFVDTPNRRENYNYLFEDGKWYVAIHDSSDFAPLTNEMVTTK